MLPIFRLGRDTLAAAWLGSSNRNRWLGPDCMLEACRRAPSVLRGPDSPS